MDGEKKIIKRNYAAYLALFIIVFITLGRIICSFAFLKEDYHPDESWSFGLANSYYEPYIYQDADETKLTHYRMWFSSDELRKYLTVDKNQSFSYDSVFYNQSKDLHPPLYYLLLHSVCSFFPDKFSYWYGFVINIVAFLILQFYLYKLSIIIGKSDLFSLCVVAYYGFTSGALNTFVFVRMYSMLTMIAVISVYYHADLYRNLESDSDKLKHILIKLVFITLAGCLTHHFFLVFAGTFSAFYCIFLLIKKKIKIMCFYGCSMLAAVGISVVVFPATINHLFERRGVIVKYTSDWQLTMAVNCALQELTGLRIRSGKTPVPLVIVLLISFLLIISIPICFLFRNEKWFIDFKLTVKSKIIGTILKLKSKVSSMDYFWVIISASCCSVIITVAETVSFIDMSAHADRYIFMVYPFICLLIVYFLNCISNLILKSKKISCLTTMIICIALCISSNVLYPCIYLYNWDHSIRNYYPDSNIIIITEVPNKLTSLTDDFLNSRMIYMDSMSGFSENLKSFRKADNDACTYLLLDNVYLVNDSNNTNDDKTLDNFNSIKIKSGKSKIDNMFTSEEFENYIINKSIYYNCDYVGVDNVDGFLFNVYKVN